MTNSTSPETVFIVEKVNGSNSGDDGIFGSTGNDQDIRVGGPVAPYFYNPGNNNDFTNGGSGEDVCQWRAADGQRDGGHGPTPRGLCRREYGIAASLGLDLVEQRLRQPLFRW